MKRSVLVGWGIGSFTSATVVSAVGLLYLRFMTDSLGVAIALAGMLVVASKIYDAILDPLMGVLSDRTHTPWGRHRPYLLIGGVLCAVALFLLFNVPAGLNGRGVIWFSAGALLLFSTAYTMFRIPYLAIGRSITQDFNERSHLMTFSVYGSSLGSLAATSAAPLLLDVTGGGRAGHGLVACILAVLIALGGCASFLLIREGTSDSAVEDQKPTKVTFKEAVSALRDNKPFQCLIGFKVVMFAGLSLHINAIPYYTRHVLGASDKILSSIFLAQTLALMGSQVLWVRLAKKLGRRNALIVAASLEICTMAAWYLVPTAHPSPWSQILGLLSGVAGGGLFFGLYTVLTDTMDHARRQSGGAGREGVLAGVFVMVEKATSAVGTFVFSAVMGMVGFVSTKNAGVEGQPHQVVLGIALTLSVLPAIAALIACLFLRGYKLPDRHEDRKMAPPGAPVFETGNEPA